MFKMKLINILILSVIPGAGLSASFTSNVDKGNKISNEVIDGIQNVSGIITNSMVITNGHQYINAGGSASHIVLNGGKSTVTDAAISSFKIISGIQNLESGAILLLIKHISVHQAFSMLIMELFPIKVL